jgi:hypothetical protein
MTNNEDAKDDDVVVAARPGVKVYSNSAGMIVLRNFADANRDDDEMIYVLIHPDDVDAVAEAMKQWRDTVQSKTT